MLTMPAPTPLAGDILTADLAAAGFQTRPYLSDGNLLVLPDLDETDRAAVQPIIDAHPAKARAAETSVATERTNETSIRDKAAAALADNKTFLAITSPTNAQIAAQVKALTRQNNALIRLVLRRFDAAD